MKRAELWTISAFVLLEGTGQKLGQYIKVGQYTYASESIRLSKAILKKSVAINRASRAQLKLPDEITACS